MATTAVKTEKTKEKEEEEMDPYLYNLCIQAYVHIINNIGRQVTRSQLFKIINMNSFNQEQVIKFLSKKGIEIIKAQPKYKETRAEIVEDFQPPQPKKVVKKNSLIDKIDLLDQIDDIIDSVSYYDIKKITSEQVDVLKKASQKKTVNSLQQKEEQVVGKYGYYYGSKNF